MSDMDSALFTITTLWAFNNKFLMQSMEKNIFFLELFCYLRQISLYNGLVFFESILYLINSHFELQI